MDIQVGAELITQLEGMLGIEFQNHDGLSITLEPDTVVTVCEYGDVMYWDNDIMYWLYDRDGKPVLSADLFPAIKTVAGLPDHASRVVISIAPDEIVDVAVSYGLPTGSLDILEGYSLKRFK